MLKKHDLGITPYTENIGSRDRSLVRMGTSRVTLEILEDDVDKSHKDEDLDHNLEDDELDHNLDDAEDVDMSSEKRNTSER